MRVGFNPNKDNVLPKSDYFHQVIIPVYIPHQNDYFKDSFTILQYCLDSLFKTSHSKTYFTIVNNGSCKEVIDYLQKRFQDNEIHELIHTTNIGKLNAILKGITGQQFPLVTITDGDVLYLNHWQKATYEVFEKFPKTGAVCPTPSSKSLKNDTFNIWFDLLFSKKLGFSNVKNPQALKAFAASVGNSNMYNSYHLEKYLTIANNEFKAVVGAGHFVTTYRRAVFEKIDLKHSSFKLGGDSEAKFLDLPVVKKGMWKLSTEDNFAYHMGNVEEKWMLEILKKIKPNRFVPSSPISLTDIKFSKGAFIFKHKLFSKIITRKIIWRYCLKMKGLSKDAVLKY